MTILLLLVGLGLVVLGADWLVEGASSIARKAGVSEFVIGLSHMLLGVGVNGLSRVEGAILLAAFASYLIHCFRKGRSAKQEVAEGKQRHPAPITSFYSNSYKSKSWKVNSRRSILLRTSLYQYS